MKPSLSRDVAFELVLNFDLGLEIRLKAHLDINIGRGVSEALTVSV